MSSYLPNAPRIESGTVRCLAPKKVEGREPLRMKPGGKETLLGYLGPKVRIVSGRMDRVLDRALRRDVLTPEKIGVDLEAGTIVPDQFTQAVAEHPEILDGLKDEKRRSGEERTPENLTSNVFCRVLEREAATTFNPLEALGRYAVGSSERIALWETILGRPLPESAENQETAVAEMLSRYYPDDDVWSVFEATDPLHRLEDQIRLVWMAAGELPISYQKDRNNFMATLAERLYPDRPSCLGEFIAGTTDENFTLDYVVRMSNRGYEHYNEDHLAALICSAAFRVDNPVNHIDSEPPTRIRIRKMPSQRMHRFICRATQAAPRYGMDALGFLPVSPSLLGKICNVRARGDDRFLASLLVEFSSLFYPIPYIPSVAELAPGFVSANNVGLAFAGPSYGMNPMTRAGRAQQQMTERNEAAVARERVTFICQVIRDTFPQDQPKRIALRQIIVDDAIGASDISEHTFRDAFPRA